MTNIHFPRHALAQGWDTLTGDLQSTLDKIDAEIARLDPAQLFASLCSVREHGDLTDHHDLILLEKLEQANATVAAQGAHDLDIHLARPDPSYRQTWHIIVMAGHINVASFDFPSFEEGKAAFDALCKFICIAGREGQFTYETPRQDGNADADPLPF